MRPTLPTCLGALGSVVLDYSSLPCPGCGLRGRSGVCSACEAQCRSKRARGLCVRGLPAAWAIDRLFFYGRYAAAPNGEATRVAAALRRFKYSGDREAGRALAATFRRHGALTLLAPGAVVPIPLHQGRLVSRGFNQAAWLARPLARAMGARLLPDALRRIRSDGPQVTRGAAERRHRIVGAFGPGPQAVAGRSVLIVDDVMTTGATLREAARALRAAGAGPVHAAVLLIAERTA